MICSTSKGFIADSNFHFGLLVSDIPGKLGLQIVNNSQEWFLRINPATTNLELLACRVRRIMERRALNSPLAKDRGIWIGMRLREWIEGRFLKPPLFWTFHALKTPKRGWFEKLAAQGFSNHLLFGSFSPGKFKKGVVWEIGRFLWDSSPVPAGQDQRLIR